MNTAVPAVEQRLLGDPMRSPLGGFGGVRPPAPEWFEWAVAQEPERSFVEVDGAAIEMLTWGRRGDPGLLLLHGFAAHADWWSFIAPFLAADGWRVAAPSWSGMGLSGWREQYSLAGHALEAVAVAEAAGLFEAAHKPIIVGHSYGSYVTLHAIAEQGERFKAAVAVDGALAPDGEGSAGSLRTSGVHRVYSSFKAALARFRFSPPQSCENLFIMDHIARYSLRQVPDGKGGDGWTWRFDPQARNRMDIGNRSRLLDAPGCPVALMVGARSKLITPERLAFMRQVSRGAPWVDIPDAGHHLMADQPLAFIAGLRGLLAGWPHARYGRQEPGEG